MHQNRASPFTSDFYRRLGYRRAPVESQRQSPPASDYDRKEVAHLGTLKIAILQGAVKNRRCNRRGSHDFGALSTSLDNKDLASKSFAFFLSEPKGFGQQEMPIKSINIAPTPIPQAHTVCIVKSIAFGDRSFLQHAPRYIVGLP